MNAVHPTFAPCFASIAPRRIKPTQTYYYTLNGVDLVCEIEFEAAEKQTRDEPGCPATAALESAHTAEGRVDVTGLISEEWAEEIEIAFLNQTEEY